MNNPGQQREKIAFVALRHREFRWYFIASMLAMMADNIEHVISYWVIFRIFHSPVLGGFAVISHWMPFLLFSFYSGALADRFDCRRLIQAGMAMFILVSLVWGILFLTQAIQVWHAVILLTVHGFAGVLWEPAALLIIHDIVGSEHLQSAIRLNATSRYLGIVLGPVIGGGLLLLVGPAPGLLVNGLIYLPLIVWLLTVAYTGHDPEARRAGLSKRFGLANTIEVLREVAGNRTILSMVLLAGASAFFVGNAFQAHMPEYAHHFGTDDESLAYSSLLAANAAGAVVGGLLLEARGLLKLQARTAVIFAILFCLSIGSFALATNYPLALALLFLAGVFNLASVTMAQTLVQLLAPPDVRGRLIGVFATSNLGLRTFSGVTVGLLGGLIGVHFSLALSATALLAVAIALLAFAVRSGTDTVNPAS
ncbi:MAG: MFS transporter [Deltaproteobacteria bacterium]|nr:MFS transporter [Deltaproteobacteria bacterium]